MMVNLYITKVHRMPMTITSYESMNYNSITLHLIYEGDYSIRVSASLGLSQAASNIGQARNDPPRTNKSAGPEGAAILEMANLVAEEDSNEISVSKLSVTSADANPISQDIFKFTPGLFPLIDITQGDIDSIVKQVKGGIANIKDIYALSPLQDGVLFHSIMAAKGDPYLITTTISFGDSDILDRYLVALQKVIDRHDIYRTAFVWEGLSRPAQVVLRHAPLPITKISLDPANGPVSEQLAAQFDSRGIQFQNEIQTLLEGRSEKLNEPQPFNDFIAQTRSGPDTDEHKLYFSKMLAEVDTPAIPFGLSDVGHGDLDVIQSQIMLPQELNDRLRSHADRMKVSVARICHLAWAVTIAKVSGQERVVFGTVISLRQYAGPCGSVMGPLINTLPIRIDVGETSVEESLYKIKTNISTLIEHKHASLTLAQRCSGVPSGTPLITSLLNFRRSPTKTSDGTNITRMEILKLQERTTYPISMNIDDSGIDLQLTCQVIHPIDASRICGYMEQSLQSIVEALDHMPKMQVRDLEVLPTSERDMLLKSWNSTISSHEHRCIHQIFEDQVVQSPDAIAIVFEDQQMTYHELNVRANSLAHHLTDLGVKPDSLVGICVDRSLAMIVGLLAILKAGGAYVPLDPMFASERLNDILEDASPSILLADESGIKALDPSISDSIVIVDPNATFKESTTNPHVAELLSHHLAYVIYTSGSTGKPKGVMVEHSQVTRLFNASEAWFNFQKSDIWIMNHTFSFDVSVWEIWGALRYGGKLIIPSYRATQSPEELYQLVCSHGVTVLNMTPSAFRPLIAIQERQTLYDNLRYIVLAGEALEPAMLQSWYATRSQDSPKIVNMYGTTETTVHATILMINARDCDRTISPIGMRIPDLTAYVLDGRGQPVPLGAIGELCIGGAGVSRGYLNRAQLTSEKFPLDPFSETKGTRMYKTGDLVRYLPDENLVYLGRNDNQVKIRGYRIELGEIEARLYEHSIVREAVVVAIGDGS
ncbi:hypothetical protein BGZ80_002024, partial [Entomortierella chlamydospora]